MADLRVDIVSDVVCPWCIIGYKRFEQALRQLDVDLSVAVIWHPFELNPDMPPEGQDLTEHVGEKYGATPEQSAAARDKLATLGESLGVSFRYGPETRIYNTFKAHQLLHWALKQGRQAPLKFALFEAYFTAQANVSDEAVLLEAVTAAGLDGDESLEVLADGRYAQEVRDEERFWIKNGIEGVPAFVIDGRYLISGAHEPDVFVDVIGRALREERSA